MDTGSILLKAQKVLRIYTEATGTKGCVLDQNSLVIHESMGDLLDARNPCLFCMKYRAHAENPSRPQDFRASPCHALHANSVQKAFHYGGSYIYICDTGFLFWTCPLVRDSAFEGALLVSGFLGIAPEECARTMSAYAGENESAEAVAARTAGYPRIGMERAKALADLLLACAESLSTTGEDYHETLRRRAARQSVIAEQLALLREQYAENSSPEYPLERERELLQALHRGDTENCKKLLDEILGVLFYTNGDQFSFIRFRAIELAVLLSRAAADAGIASPNEQPGRFIRAVQETENAGDLADVLHGMVETLSEQIFSFQGVRHGAALQKAERYIQENFTRKISLKEIARNSGLSAPYFSTIFREEMGENLSSYLNRLRVEKAGRLLLETEMSLAEIAGSCGFEDQSWFSKIFRGYTGTSPGKYRSQGGSRPSAVHFPESVEAGIREPD